MSGLACWNHNAAYYPWIKEQIRGCRRILDVGCGDGTLVRYLQENGRSLVGIDVSPTCIARAEESPHDPGTRFILSPFSAYPEVEAFDAVVFSASLHHMDMPSSLEKAKRLLTPDGRLLIVGLASPSSLWDRLLDVFRVIPAGIGTRIHRMRAPEELGIPVCGKLPKMQEIRDASGRHLPGAGLRRGLYWRYLLFWQK